MVASPDPNPFAPPRKRSIAIAGHETSVSLEPIFWQALEEAAATQGVPLSTLVARIDALRVAATPAPNLASALRTWLLQTVTNANTYHDGVDTENDSQ